VGITSLAFASLLLAALVPILEPWIAPAKPALLVLLAGAAAGAAATLIGARRAPAWSSADDVAWVVALAALASFAGASSVPVGFGMLLYAVSLMALAARDPSGALVVIACATTALPPVVHMVMTPAGLGVVPMLFATILTGGAFSFGLAQTRRLSRALAERDAALTDRPATPRAVASGGGRASSRSSNTESSRQSNGGDDHTWDALVERVRSSVTLMAESAGVEASVQAELSGLAPPSNKIRVHLLRIAQEATTQAIRHAEPRSIVVRLRRGEGGVVFELQDDGVANEGVRQRRGLATLRGRVAALGGTAEVRRADGGWVTRVRLPCEQLN
jgi:signal transduction histidine kinase